MPCAAAATAQMEATRKDDNLIFERRLRDERIYYIFSVDIYPLFMGALLGPLSLQVDSW